MSFPFTRRPATPDLSDDPRPGAIAAAAIAAHPLDAREVVPDATLRMLAKLAQHDPDLARGVFNDELAAMLAPVLPDLLGELLARRIASDLQQRHGARP